MPLFLLSKTCPSLLLLYCQRLPPKGWGDEAHKPAQQGPCPARVPGVCGAHAALVRLAPLRGTCIPRSSPFLTVLTVCAVHACTQIAVIVVVVVVGCALILVAVMVGLAYRRRTLMPLQHSKALSSLGVSTTCSVRPPLHVPGLAQRLTCARMRGMQARAHGRAVPYTHAHALTCTHMHMYPASCTRGGPLAWVLLAL